jgi:hypothetical protein
LDSTRSQGRRLAPEVFRGWTVEQWYTFVEAIYEFVDQEWVRQHNEAYEKINKAFGEFDTNMTDQKQYEYARRLQVDADAYDNLIFEELHERLARGELIARGFREPLSHGAPYLTISRHEWRIIKFELPNRAVGGGISYIGLTIGKPGAKRFFRRRK